MGLTFKKYAQVNRATGYCGSVVSTTNPMPSTAEVEMILIADDEVRDGHSWDGKSWTAPVVVSYVRAYDLFSSLTPQERVLFRKSDDDTVQDFHDHLKQAISSGESFEKTPGGELDLALSYVASLGLLTNARKEELLS
jgi:hypothetical protein